MAARHPLQDINDFQSLVEYLRDELDWPIDDESFDDLTFDFAPEELGLKPDEAAKVRDIKQLRPLTTNQPWGIFFVTFEPKRLPVVALRKILGNLVVKKRSSANRAERASWKLHDLLFISAFGAGDDRQITLAHFSEGAGGDDVPTLKVLGWDELDTRLNLQHIDRQLHERLCWPDDPADLDAWREQWSAAFTLRHRHVISTAQDLAVRLAVLAQSIRQRVRQVLEIETEAGALRKLYAAFRESLIHDLTEDDFADMYAQTITYGLFSAAVSRTTPNAGTVVLPENLADMVPITNPFLREMLSTFLTVGGRKGRLDFDELGIQEVVEVLNSPDTNLTAVVRNFGDRRQGEDPVIHFYEDFLKQYDKQKKVERGVFYTPQPVVSYIVRRVHELLKTEFGLEDGLASTITWGEMAKRIDGLTIPKGAKADDPFVVILDPATGTATFLVEVIDCIYRTMTEKWKRERLSVSQQQDAWDRYVAQHLLPRLYGYELMMAPYAIAHMKIGLKLGETGYRFQSDSRARVYLTNSLEPPSDLAATTAANLFEALGHEAQAVNDVKRKQSFTVIVGNPPYSKASKNLGDQFLPLIDAFRMFGGERIREPGAILFERDINNDYVKFVGFSRNAIDAAGVGIISMITSSSYLDGKNFRGVRDALTRSFDRLDILNLHGDSRSGAMARQGITDENVFAIETGVSIICGVRRSLSTPACSAVQYAEMSGSYTDKAAALTCSTESIHTTSQALDVRRYKSFVPTSSSVLDEYAAYIRIDKAFGVAVDGVKTSRDGLVISNTRSECIEKIREFMDFTGDDASVATRFSISVSKWDYRAAQKHLRRTFSEERVERLAYRPFDFRFIYYDPELVFSHRREKMRHLLRDDNLALVCASRLSSKGFNHVLPANCVVEMKYASHDTNSRVFPWFLYEESLLSEQYEVNLPPGSERDVSDHSWREWCAAIVAILNSEGYRTRYIDEVKNDFPAIPRNIRPDLLEGLSSLGQRLIDVQLLQFEVPDSVFSFEGQEGGVINTPVLQNGRLSLTAEGCFNDVTEDVFEFTLAGYQVCKNWVSAGNRSGIQRKGSHLTRPLLTAYRKVLFAVRETVAIRQEIDQVIDRHGGWPDAFLSNSSSDSVPGQVPFP